MHIIRVHKVINHLISFLHRMSFWHRGDKPTVRELGMKWFYCIYYSLFDVALAVGAISNKSLDESIFTADIAVKVSVLVAKISLLIWKQKEIMLLIDRIGVFSIRNYESFTFCTKKLERFMQFVVACLSCTLAACALTSVVVPFIGSDRYMIVNIAFPLDWKNDVIAYWIAVFFVGTETFLTIAPIIFSIIIWYLMLYCSLRYEVLARDLKRLGQISEQEKAKTLKREARRIFLEGSDQIVEQERPTKMSEREAHRIFLRDLKLAIVAYRHLRGLTDELQSFSANLFFMQFCTSGICIGASTYCLAFDISENLVERMIFVYSFVYSFSELFVITYFGNEIKLSSNRLSYSLFESDWIEQPRLTNNSVIVFGEFLKQPHEIFVGKIYPLTLETFNRILNSAYSMFNILKGTQVQ